MGSAVPSCSFDRLAETDVMAIQVLSAKFAAFVGLIAESVIDLRSSTDEFVMESVNF